MSIIKTKEIEKKEGLTEKVTVADITGNKSLSEWDKRPQRPEWLIKMDAKVL